MDKRALASLAAMAAALPAAAAAQTAAPPVKWEDVPRARLAIPAPPAAGVSWQQPRAVATAPHAGVRHHGERRFRHIARIPHGGSLHRFWWGPQFHVRHWDAYGFPAPAHGRRWVRYYDDAYLIDEGGRVHDGRYGLDWDQYEEGWGYDDRGIPAYVGDGDFEPRAEDYAWVEGGDRWAGRGDHEPDESEWDEDYDRPYPPAGHHRGHGREGYAYGHHGAPCQITYTVRDGAPPPPPPPCAYSHGGYAYGGMIVTETTVTIGGGSAHHHVVREKRAVHRPARHHKRKHRARHAPAAYGEKG